MKKLLATIFAVFSLAYVGTAAANPDSMDDENGGEVEACNVFQGQVVWVWKWYVNTYAVYYCGLDGTPYFLYYA